MATALRSLESSWGDPENDNDTSRKEGGLREATRPLLGGMDHGEGDT